MIQPTYPGVYIQEVASGVRTIVGVATSVAAFVDFFPNGPMNEAVQVFSFADVERAFGGLDARSEASYALQQFFLNGGSVAWVVRVSSTTAANSAKTAGISMADAAGAVAVLTAAAASPGGWGNRVLLDVDHDSTDPATQFNLAVSALAADGSVVAAEAFRNLSIGPNLSNDAAAVVNAASRRVRLSAGTAGKRPMPTGTATTPTDKKVADLALAFADTAGVSLNGTDAGKTEALAKDKDSVPATWPALAQRLQVMLRKLKGLGGATVAVGGSAATKQYLVVKAGTDNPADVVGIDETSGLGKSLAFAKALQNVQQYALGAAAAAAAQVLPAGKAQPGSDGTLDTANDADGFAGGLIGDADSKSGMQALRDVDLFNILCIPATMVLPDAAAAAVSTAAIALCTERRAMYLLDTPQKDQRRDTLPAIMSWLDTHGSLRSRNAALYFPRIDMADANNGFRPRKVAPSGTVAGLWARTDGARGVWKAPAGTEASLAGVTQLEYRVTDPENGVLNPLAINCLRTFPVYGPVCWGARTLFGADQMADDYKYIPIRRLALFIEESLFRGTQWVVFEPNDAPLWAQIRLNVGAFMQTLFRQGAFQGTTPQQAYFVQCDPTNNPQATIDLGIVNIHVGFAPLKPAEFVVITIQQMAGQLAA